MRSSFSGLDIAYRALQAQQQAINVINHNIANANTPGYSRQIADLAATEPYTLPSLTSDVSAGQMGTGVAVIDVRRSRDSFIDYQIRSEQQTLGSWTQLRDALKKVEVVFNEPSDAGLNSLLSQFWNAWHDVSNAPEDIAARRTLAEQADSLAVAFNRVYSQLETIRSDLDRQISLSVDGVNSLAQRIAALNVKISQAEISGQRANDLRDQRDVLLDDLSSIARVSYSEATDGSMTVFLGGHQLVCRDRSDTLHTAVDSSGVNQVVWSDGDTASLTGGEFYGLQQARDVELPSFLTEVNALASQLISSVNSLHRSGYGLDNSTGLDFFTGNGAGDIAVNSALQSRPEQIAAAAQSDSPGDNSLALAIASLQRQSTMSNGTADFGRFFASTMARLGTDSQRAEMMASNEQLLIDHLSRQRASISGVSLDEESTQLIEHQRAYEAASRVINAVDQMLDKLINGTGLVGR